MTTSENIKLKISNSISFKLVVILLLILLMQIPLSFVRGLIFEREHMQQQAQNQISQRWGGDQYIGAPILNTYTQNSHILNAKSKNKNSNNQILHSTQAHTFDLEIQLEAERRYLGIYEASVFVSDIRMSGTIELRKTIQPNNHQKLFIPIKQLQGLKELNKISIDQQIIKSLPLQASINNLNGIEIDLTGIDLKEVVSYEIDLKLVGSRLFEILPLARKTTVNMSSNWQSPSFIGHSLPDTRKIDDSGFTASWHINKFIQNLGNNSKNNHFLAPSDVSAFGVKVLIPANIYQVNERTVKYSFLIVLLTFAGFFLAELFFKLRLHPFQYLLIGVSLSVFYLLLLSLSEYVKFNWAFFISALSIIVLIGSYCSVVLQQRKRGIYTGLLFALLYGFIFVLVKAEETSLLMGAIGIWLILALIMYLTRKIDWYSVSVIDKNLSKIE